MKKHLQALNVYVATNRRVSQAVRKEAVYSKGFQGELDAIYTLREAQG